jgi:hypothetical protein
VRRYHEKQIQASWTYTEDDGTVLGQQITPLDRVGLYVPGGKAAYPSSVLMNAIPARVAGVGELIMVVPTPGGEQNQLVLAAAAIAGVDRVFTIGGAQAVAALAYGTETVPQVDKIVGPGNAYVAAAKRRVFGTVGIDMIAGPSEILVIADGNTPPEWVAMDLFSQAEHDEMAQSILLSPDVAYLDAVAAAIDRLIVEMPRSEVIRTSLTNRGALIKTRDLADAAAISNAIAPEHLELSVADPDALLAAILALVFLHAGATGVTTFDARTLMATPLTAAAAMWIMLGFFVAFAVKLPAVPLHTWLVDAHTEAPTGGSVLLAGLLLKTGAYGMLRLAIPLFPQTLASFTPAALILGVVGILYGAMLAFAQTDFKRMVAYSSISHMGFVLLGIYVGSQVALQGAMIQIIAHGLGTGALFVLSGSILERCGTRNLDRLGGLWSTAPRLGGFVAFFAMAALGLPGLANFLGEFLVLLGAYQVSVTLAAVGSVGLVLSTVYALRLVQESVHGPNREGWRVPDLSARELVTLGVMAAILVWLGFLPRPVLQAARAALASPQHQPAEFAEAAVSAGARPAVRSDLAPGDAEQSDQ